MGFEAANVNSVLELGLYPVLVSTPDRANRNYRISTALWPQLPEKCKTRSLRQVARDYGASHETVRRASRKARSKAANVH
jgi:hypothetical protein